MYNAVKNDIETFSSKEDRIADQINVINLLLRTPDSISTKYLPNLLAYLTAEDISSYVSETDHHISNLKYNINNTRQNELPKQITRYANSIKETLDLGLVERITPLLHELEIPEPIWSPGEEEKTDENENYYSNVEYEKLKELVRTSNFKTILKTLKSKKFYIMARVSNFNEDGISVMQLIKTYYPEVRLLYQDLGIIGTAINGYDDVGSKSTPLIQTDVENSVWEVDLFLKKGTVKFRCRDSWNQNWGGTTFLKGKAVTDGDNIIVEEGKYHIILNLSENTYEFVEDDEK